jgi:4-hydroxy-2-oxoheptanedioate aldolase
MVSQLLREKLASGQSVIGPLLQEIPNSPELVEFMIAAGFDYVIVDGEHGGVSVETCRTLVRAAESMGGCALARVPNADPARILAFLDQGVQGIILAHCRSRNDAEALVRAVKYPPRGIRGAAGGSRAASYGYARPPREHVEVANASTLCFGLIEDPEAVPEVDEMLAIEGFDGCFLGAGDMALSMGREYFGNPTTHSEVQRMIDRVHEETLAAGKYVMAPAGSGDAANALIARGVQLVVVQFGQFSGAPATPIRARRANGETLDELKAAVLGEVDAVLSWDHPHLDPHTGAVHACGRTHRWP